jgi:hypothetical protein
MGFPVCWISWPHDATFCAEVEPLRHAITESSIDPHQIEAHTDRVIFCIYGRTNTSEIFAGEKHAKAVEAVQVVEQHSVNLRR